ncbi:MAG: isoprenyl transferase [Pseudomonadota bacterium]
MRDASAAATANPAATVTVPAPNHVAIIMDGNGRWAAERHLPRSVGHRYGVEAVRRTVHAAIALQIKHLTLYSFSAENWSRPATEIDDLMGLIRRFLRRDLAELHAAGVRIRTIGRRERVAPDLLKLIDDAVELTHANEALTLVLAFNYGARDEIVDAARRLARLAADGALAPEDICHEHLARALDTSGVPDPDVLIRTSGEIRLSNFLLWQIAYTELVFMDAYWPEFGHDLLAEAIKIYHQRERRFGGLASATAP